MITNEERLISTVSFARHHRVAWRQLNAAVQSKQANNNLAKWESGTSRNEKKKHWAEKHVFHAFPDSVVSLHEVGSGKSSTFFPVRWLTGRSESLTLLTNRRRRKVVSLRAAVAKTGKLNNSLSRFRIPLRNKREGQPVQRLLLTGGVNGGKIMKSEYLVQ